MIRHHLDEALLLEYASGAANPPRALLAATHLTLCPACRDQLAAVEAVGGELLDLSAGPTATDALLAATLAHLDDPPPPPPRFDPNGVLPAPLAAVVGRFSDLPWRRPFPLVEEVPVELGYSGFPARLFRLAAGSFVPWHEHMGDEITLILTGGFSDDRGHYGRGDVCVRDPGELHRQSIDRGDPCVVLVAADAPFRPRSPIAAIASWFGRF